MNFADVAELADALVLGTSANGVGVRVPSSAPIYNNLRTIKFVGCSFMYKLKPSINEEITIGCSKLFQKNYLPLKRV